MGATTKVKRVISRLSTNILKTLSSFCFHCWSQGGDSQCAFWRPDAHDRHQGGPCQPPGPSQRLDVREKKENRPKRKKNKKKEAMPASWPLSTSGCERKKGETTNTKKTQKKVGGPLKTPILLALIRLCDKEARTTNDHQWHHQMITLNLTIYALWLLTKCDKVSLFHLASIFNIFHTHQVYYSSIRSSMRLQTLSPPSK